MSLSKTWLESNHPDTHICGIDEAGRGPLAGPCVVVGVILPLNYIHPLINDSKQLTEKQREMCYRDIISDALWVSIDVVSPNRIDALNIYQATKQSMRFIASLAPCKLVFTDAMPFQLMDKEVMDFVKGDAKSINIAAASIVAKVMRDHLMNVYDEKYPYYGFRKHKGYPTQAHLKAIEEYGVLDIHRKSYGPVSKALQIKLF